ncbi:MAG: glycosyltransferase, partial [Myxococcota bacterium]
MRILFHAEGTRGDLYPLLALGEACRDARHEVVVLAPDNFRAEVSARGFGFRSGGIDARAYLDRHAGAIVGGGLALVRAQRDYLASLIGTGFERLLAASEDTDLLVGAGVCVTAATVAAARGIPFRYVAYCPPLLPSDEHTPVLLGLSRRLPPWLNRLAWRWLMPALYLPIVRAVNRRRAELGIVPERNGLRLVPGDDPVLLANDAEVTP